MRLPGRLAHLFDRDRNQDCRERFRPPYARLDQSPARAAPSVRRDRPDSRGAQRHRDAHDLAHSDAPPLARPLVAASRPKHALEDPGVDKALEHHLQATGRQFMARGQVFGVNRSRARV